MLLKVLIVVAGIIVLFAIIVALQPSDFRVTRSAIMSAPALAVFAQVMISINGKHGPLGENRSGDEERMKARRPEPARFTLGSVTKRSAKDA